MKKLVFVFLIGLLSASFQGVAQEVEKPVNVKFLIDAGLEYGGDKIATITFTTGDDQKMLAGQGGSISVGADFKFSAVKFLMVRTSLGIKYSTTAAENANIYLSRMPFHLVPSVKFNNIRFGVGIAKHLNVKFHGDNLLPDVSYSSTLGPRFEIGYKGIALTYTAIKYKHDILGIYNAGSFGVSFSLTLPNK